LSTARCEAAYPSRVITLGAPCCLTAREKNRRADCTADATERHRCNRSHSKAAKRGLG
jgi:hypothetical protein